MSLVHNFDSINLGSEKPGVKVPLKKKRKSPVWLFLKIILAGFIVLTIGLALSGYFLVYKPLQVLMGSLKKLEGSATPIAALIKKQDLGGTKTQLDLIKTNLTEVENNFQTFKWAASIPVAKDYYSDGIHGLTAAKEILASGYLAIDGITPYADIIGLKGVTPTTEGGKTAQERINMVVSTLEKLKPQLEGIGKHLEIAKNEVAQIDPKRYPETFQGQEIKSQIEKGKLILDEAAVLTNEARPLLETAPYILGMDAPRKYLVMFQNDAELRPTGGFMTAYAILQVSKGKISTLASDDIYKLDEKFTKKIPAPQAILKYLPKVYTWNLRDQNLSPDFKTSMDTFYPNYLLTGSPKVDGIIAMDTQVLVDLLKITGKLGVPGFGNFSADLDPVCNCPQVFYALELYADVEGPVIWDSVSGRIIAQPANYGQRKSFIGPMMYSILSNVMAQPKSKMADMFNTAMSLIAQKHVQFYFNDKKAQAAVETFNLAGRVRDSQGDYLMVVDTNFAGAKTNVWVTYNADLKVEAGKDGTTNILSLTYQNPQPYFTDPKTNLKLNGVFRDWFRLYLPKGSTLIEAKGFETGLASGEDLGKSVIEGFFTLTPKNNKTITIKYKTPVKSGSPYQLLIQKQAGAKSFPYKISVNNVAQPEVILDADKEIAVSY